MCHEAGKRCAQSPQGVDLMESLAIPAMGTLQNYHEWLTLRATWAAMMAYLNGRRYGSRMPDAKAARKMYTWVENGVEQTCRPKVIAPFFQLAVRTDDPVWEKFCNDSVKSQSLL